MRDPLLHIPFASDFDELCGVADQTRSVDIDILDVELRIVTRIQSLAQQGRLAPSHLRNLGNFEDLA
jgi:hypothetical protein